MYLPIAPNSLAGEDDVRHSELGVRKIQYLSINMPILWGLVVLAQASTQPAQGPLHVGLDHIPVAVRDLDSAIETYRDLGFTIKPGRAHKNQISNAHVKFSSGAGIELLSAPKGLDALSTFYVEFLLAGDGPAFASFHARESDSLREALDVAGYDWVQNGGITELVHEDFKFLFFIRDNRSSTDMPEHLTHDNSAIGLNEIWIATDDAESLSGLLVAVGGNVYREQVLAPFNVEALVVALGQGKVIILPERFRVVPGRPVVGASFAVKDIQKVRHAIDEAGIDLLATDNSKERIVIEPQSAHGLWLEFCLKQ